MWKRIMMAVTMARLSKRGDHPVIASAMMAIFQGENFVMVLLDTLDRLAKDNARLDAQLGYLIDNAELTGGIDMAALQAKYEDAPPAIDETWVWKLCSRCDGSGETYAGPCMQCNGRGRRLVEVNNAN